MRAKLYATYRNCEIRRDSRGWFFTALVRGERFGESATLRSKRVYVDNPAGALDRIVSAIDEYLSETA